MKPVLIYTKEEAKRNRFAADKICALTGARLVTPDYDGEALYVINRTNDFRVAERFEARGVRVFNPAAFSRLANDKQACYDFMETHGVPVLPTRYKTPPFVKKPKNGHGGEGVLLCTDEAQYDETMVCQKAASDLGRDLRVWVIGGEIVTAILRVSQTDFRSNYCLGGEAIPYALSQKETAQVKKIISLVQGDYYGIDFVFDNGAIIFNELEDTVGARMVYAKTDIDILRLYCNYITGQMEKPR